MRKIRNFETRMNGTEIERKCTKCGEFKLLSEYHFQASGLYNTTSICKKCKSSYGKEWQENNRELSREYSKRWKEKNPEILRKYTLDKYSLTQEEFNKFAINGCMICGTYEKLCIDHNHITNENRGILCQACNVGMGNFKDNVDLLLRAAAYLEDSRSIQEKAGVSSFREVEEELEEEEET